MRTLNRLIKTLSAVGMASLLTLSLSACGDSKNEVEKPKETVQSVAQEEEVEEQPEAEELSPGEFALMVVNAVRGDEEPLVEYGTNVQVGNVVTEKQEGMEAALEMMLDVPPTEEQIDTLNAAISDAIAKTEVELLEEEVDGDQGRAVVSILGIDHEEGTDLAGSDPEVKELVFGDADDMFYMIAIKGWELSPLMDEPYVIEFNYTMNAETGKWEAADTDVLRKQTMIAPALLGETSTLEYIEENL